MRRRSRGTRRARRIRRAPASRRYFVGAGATAASAASALLVWGIWAIWPKSTPAVPLLSVSTSPALVAPMAPSSPASAVVPERRTRSATSATPTPVRTISARKMREKLTAALDRYLRDRPGELSLSIRDLSTGFAFTYRPKTRIVTASIVKVDILVALLLKAQRERRQLTTAEKTLAAKMIKFSDNKAANALWRAAGGSAGLAAANEKLRLRGTRPDPGGVWGRTTTSAADQVRIMRALTSARSPLSATGRRYVLGLMSHVTPKQVWGVSAAAADEDDSVALKNGWLPRPVDGGRWTINSIGRVGGGGHHDYLIAVLSKLNPSMSAGVETVEHAVRLVATTLRKAR